MLNEILFDRSRNETFQKCPRKRFLEYEYPNPDPEGAHGLRRVSNAVPLLTGSMVHKGIELIPHQGEGAALDAALSAYDEEVERRGIAVEQAGVDATLYVTSTIKVQRALIEALISGYGNFVWPRIEAEFDVIDVEREERVSYEMDGNAITLMARTDTLVKRKSDGEIFVRNYKTIAEASDYKLEGYRYDTQTISEVVAVENRLGQPIGGVIYDFLIKGKKNLQWPYKSGIWHNSSPLIWCWYKPDQFDEPTDANFAVKWEHTCDGPHKMGRGECPGFRNHTLGHGWRRELVTDVVPGGINGWFNWLQTNAPGTIDEQFVSIPPIMRTPFDIATWQRIILNEEYNIWQKAEQVRSRLVPVDGDMTQVYSTLDTWFPKHTHNSNCLFPTKCPMFDICWMSAAADPLANGYEYRSPNHPENLVRIEE